MRQIRNLIFRLLYVPISPTFCGQYIMLNIEAQIEKIVLHLYKTIL